MRSILAGTLAISIAAAAVVSARQFPAPAGWKWITDGDARIVSALDPPEGSWLFGTMAPGWRRPLRARVRNLSVPRAQRRGIRRVHRRPRSRIEGPPGGLPHPARRKRGGRIARRGTHHVAAAVDQGRLDPPRRGDRRRCEERAAGRSRSDVVTHRLALPRRAKQP